MSTSQKFTHAKTGFDQEIIYAQILLASFLFGFLVSSKYISPGTTRRYLTSSFGLTLVYLSSGTQILHSLSSCLLIYLIIKISHTLKLKNSITEWLCFSASLIFLLFFRICHDYWPSQFNKISPFANVVQLIMTLRLVSFGFEHSAPETFTTFSDFLTYCYSYIGFFSGPFYRKCVFDDFCNLDSQVSSKIPIKNILIETLKPLPITVILYLALKTWMPVDYYRSEQFLSENSILTNVLALQVQFAWCRFRFYTAWMLAEATCISARLGAYKKSRQARPGLGPKLPETEADASEPVEYDFNAIWNLKKEVCEFEPSLRQCMRDWNCSVQWWLANYTYKKLPNANVIVRLCFTMFISAYWHGIAPGYFLGFMCVPLLTQTEDLITKAFKHDFPQVRTILLYILKHVSFSMTGMAFLLLDYKSVINCWKASGYAIFVVNIAFIIASGLKILIFPGKGTREKKE